MINEIKVIDNFLPQQWFMALQYESQHYLQYRYREQTSIPMANGPEEFRDKNTFDVGQMECDIFVLGAPKDQIKFSDYFPSIVPLQYILDGHLKDTGFQVVQPGRIKYNLLWQVKDAPEDSYNIAHPDANDDHISMILYMNDSDGDTIIFDQDSRVNQNPKELTIRQRITPKANRALIFDSSLYHASSQPRNTPVRRVLNAVYYAVPRKEFK